ncbi:hypothetical protein TWF506_000325 [Arthrobotrys conoides]|uniref:Aminoglycoside phosphotransferase domain-containing protein n=1 Tax=Arthrobotrys conoides TaxID=74498 RepID=A0AAN8RWK1_9PEZI
MAETITGYSVIPTNVQGGNSYTLDVGEFVIQSRDASSPLDIGFLGYVEQVYTGLMPHHESLGKLGHLHVYQMRKVYGVSMYLARNQLHSDNYHPLRKTLRDYAKFFASAWYNTPIEMPRPSWKVLLAQYSAKLSELREGVPQRFHLTLDYIIPRLPKIFAPDWPLVPNHTDLLENNTHVDLATGALAAICDWRDIEITPFGMSLGGLETMLGINRVRVGWCYHSNQQDLRDLFWESFYESMASVSNDVRGRIEAARLVGLFMTHGFNYDASGNPFAASDGNAELDYLEAVILASTPKN